MIKKLVGEKCILSVVDDTYADTIAMWSNDLEVGLRTGDLPDMISISKQKEYLNQMNQNGYAYLILTKDEKPVGLCRLMLVDHIQQTATLGIFIGDKKYHHQGIGTEAIELLLDFGFNILNLHNVMLRVFSFNMNAINLYEKLGFKEIGRRREAIRYGNLLYDIVYMDILSSEFSSPMVIKTLNKV